MPDPEDRLPTVTSVCIPDGPRATGACAGNCSRSSASRSPAASAPLKGKIWRIGLMGYASQIKYVLMFLAALEKVLLDQGLRVVAPGAGVGAAVRSYAVSRKPAGVGRSESKRPASPWRHGSANRRFPIAGAMSEFVAPFDVPSSLPTRPTTCRFSHLWNGIATRHSDTIDTKFFVDGTRRDGRSCAHRLRRIPQRSRDATSPIARPFRRRRIPARAARAGRRAPALRRL